MCLPKGHEWHTKRGALLQSIELQDFKVCKVLFSGWPKRECHSLVDKLDNTNWFEESLVDKPDKTNWFEEYIYVLFPKVDIFTLLSYLITFVPFIWIILHIYQ